VVALSTAEATILRVLLEKNGEFVRTDELLKYISPSPMASENLVHGAVRGLRRTLNDADLIRNERSKGYSFTGEFEARPAAIEELRGRQTVTSATQATPAVTIQSTAGEDRPRPPRDSFVAVALLVTAPVVLLPFGLILFGGNWESLPRQLGFIEALMILVALAYDFYFLKRHRSADESAEVQRAVVAVRQLRRFWRLLLASWCCLYLTLPFSQWFTPVTSTHAAAFQWQAVQVIATFLNNASALMLVLCYVVLNRPTVIKVVDRDVEDISVKPGLLLIVGFGLLEAGLVAVSGRFGFPDRSEDILFGFDLLSGVVGGIAMALCISRLDSRLLGTNTKGMLPVIPVVLYFYVVIQPFYPLINRTFPNRAALSQHFDLWIIQLAFMFKAVMYIYVTELFRSERFLFYMIHARRIYENVESEWSSFKRS
jgi:DNA-binding winged helix-turn-helix (wHTH) protein